MKIKYTARAFTPGDKRFYVPGLVVEEKCPECGARSTVDAGQHYFSYPAINADAPVYFQCPKCDAEFEGAVHLALVVTPA